MTFPAAPGAPQELLATYVSVVPSLAGSQEILRDAAREGARIYGRAFEEAVGPELSAAMGRVGGQMSSALSSGLGSAAGQAILSKLLPNESVVTGHMGRIGKAAAGAYTQEFNAKYRDMVPVIEDVSARAVAANKALVEQTRAMGGQMSSFWYSSSREATQAGDEMLGAWASKMKVGVAAAGALAAVEFVHSVKKVFSEFEHVGEDAGKSLVDGFESVVQGKMPDLIQPFDVLEEAAKASLTAPLQVAQTFVPALGLVKRGVEDLFGPFDQLKDALTPVVDDMLEIGDEYLEMTRKIASSTTNTEGIEELAGAVRDIMASGAVVHFKDVADSIGRLNDNIQGLSLEQLKELTKTFAEAEELVGHIDETKFAGILNAWQIPAEKANETLTVLVNTARATGISFNEMTSEMTMSGPAMRELGYNIQDTASFFALMTEKGEKGTRLIFGMNDVVAKLNQQVEKGVFKNAKEGWQSLIDAVNAYHKAGDEAAAFDLLKQYMPANSATLMKDLMEQGIVSVDNAGVHIEGLNEDLGEAVEKTKSLGDTFMVIGQQVSAAVAPVGMALAVGLRDAGNHVTEWLEKNQGRVAQWAADIAKGFLTVGTFVTQWFANTLKAMSPLFEAMKDMVLGVTLPLSPLAHGMAAVFGGGWETLAGAIDKVNGSMMNFDIGKYLGEFDRSVNDFARDSLPKIDAAIQAPVDNLKLDDEMRKKGFHFWFEDGDPAKVKVKPQTQDGQDVNSASDLVPPGETTLQFVPQPGWNIPKYQAPTPLPGYAFGGPTVQGDWKGQDDTIPAYLSVGEYVVNRAAAQKNRRLLDAINFGHAGFDAGGDVDPGLTVLYGFLRGAAEGVGLNLPKGKTGDGGSGLPSMYASVASQSAPQLAAAAASPGHGGDVKQQAYNAMIAAGGSPSDWPAIDYIFSHESSWSTTAQNNWDINAQHGDPSKGLGQLISGNYRAAGVDPNTTDAYQQTFAAVKYMQSRYGSIQGALQYWKGHHNYAGGGSVGSKEDPNGPAFSQVIWSNKETGQDIGEAGGQWVGTPGSADPGYYHRGHNDFPDHTGHVHTTVVKDPFTGAPYDLAHGAPPAGADIRQGQPGFPDWVYRLGKQFGVVPSTYPGHQAWNGVNHGIDWWPADARPNMTGAGYSHQDFVTLTAFASAAGASATRDSQGAPSTSGGVFAPAAAASDGIQLAGYDSTGGGAPFGGGSFPPGSPIGPGGLIGPGYNPWTNPPRGLTATQRQDYEHKYEQWQLQEQERQNRLNDARDQLKADWDTQHQLQEEYNRDLGAWNKKVKEQLATNPQFKGWTDEQVSDYLAKQGGPDATKLAQEKQKLDAINKKLRDEQNSVQEQQLQQQIGTPPPKPEQGARQGGPFEGMSEQLGSGLVKGIFQELGFPDVFGKPFTQWGLWKLGMGVLGFGLNYANNWAESQGGGQNAFPGSLPGQAGGPLGPPPGAPPGSVPPSTPATPPPGTPDHPLSVQGAPNKTPVHTEPAKPAPPHPATPSLPWPPKPPRPEPGQPGGGPPLGIPGSEGGGPQVFSVPQSPQQYHTAAYYEQQANQPSPFSFGPNSLGAGAVGGDYMQQLVNQGPSFLVGLQDQNFRNRLVGQQSPSKLAGHMQAAKPEDNSRYAESARNVNFNNFNTGVTDTKTISKVVSAHYNQEKRWAPPNQMFRTGVTIA